MKLRLAKFAPRAIVGLVFIAAGFEKVLQPEAFAAAMRNYHLVPDGLVNVLALGLPMTELGAGLCLLFGIMPRVMGWLFCSLLMVFLGAMAFALWRGEPMNCGCFLGGEASMASLWISFLRNCALLLATLCIIAIHPGRKQEVSGASK